MQKKISFNKVSKKKNGNMKGRRNMKKVIKEGLIGIAITIAVSGWKLYLAKFLPDVLVVSVGMGIAVGITSFLYGIHWGNIFLSAVLVLLTIMASSAFGLMLYYTFNNLIITIIILEHQTASIGISEQEEW